MKSILAATVVLIAVSVVGICDICRIKSKPALTPVKLAVGVPDVVMEVMDPSLQGEPIQMWQKEIGRRFHNAAGIVCHGGEMVEGQWVVKVSGMTSRAASPVQSLVRHYQELYPGRTIVLLACNPGHLPLGIKGVYYAPSSVWVIPDREMTPELSVRPMARATFFDWRVLWPAKLGSRWATDPDVVGNIFEFISE